MFPIKCSVLIQTVHGSARCMDRNLKHLTIVEAEFDLRPKLYQRAWPSYKHFTLALQSCKKMDRWAGKRH